MCAVIALALACEASYNDALAALQLTAPGYDPTRKSRAWPADMCGDACWAAILAAVELLDYQVIARNVVGHGPTLRQFERDIGAVGRYILETRAHACACVDGEVLDWTARHGRRRIRAWYQVEPISQPRNSSYADHRA